MRKYKLISCFFLQLEQCKCTIDQTDISICQSSSNFVDVKNQLPPINEDDELEKFQPPNMANKVDNLSS